MTRPTPILRKSIAAAGLAAFVLTAGSPVSAADWMPDMPDIPFEGSAAEQGMVTALDAVVVRPLASMRLAVGVGLFIPAALFSLPMGREGFDGAYDTLVAEPYEFAFEREMGEF